MKVTIAPSLCNAIHLSDNNGIVLFEMDPQKIVVCTVNTGTHDNIKRIFRAYSPHTEIIAPNDHHPPIFFVILSGINLLQVKETLRHT